MEWNFALINWPAVVVSVVASQIISTVWFVPLFGEPWAREYGATSRQEHTKAVPPWTYGVQLVCTVLMVISLAVLHRALGVGSVVDGVAVGGIVALGFAASSIVSGQAFLQRWRVAALCAGCQATMILASSTILGAWR